MRIRAIHRYFWPDTPPYATFLKEMASDWSSGGHDVTVVTAPPSQGSRGSRPAVDGVRVEQVPVVPESGHLPGRLLNFAVFPLAAGMRLLRGPRPDLVMCSTAPQVLLGVAASLAARRRGAAFVYHCMDLHPEIGRLSGEFANPVVHRVLLWLDTATMRRATRVVVLSEDMRDAVLARDAALADSVIVLNNFALGDDRDDDLGGSPVPDPGPGVLRVVFTGNLGRFQALPDLVDSLPLVGEDVDVELVFMGSGRARDDVERAVAALPEHHRPRVLLVPPGPPSAAKALMRTAHLGVVSLAPEVARYAYPSKTATYAEQGLPFLVVCEPDTELASSTERAGVGWSVAPGDVPGIAAALTEAGRELAEGRLADRQRRVRDHFEATFGRERVLTRWRELLDEVAEERSRTAEVRS